MMEQPPARHDHGDAIPVAGPDHQVVPDGASRLGDIGDAAAPRPLHVVREGEEGVAAQGHARCGLHLQMCQIKIKILYSARSRVKTSQCFSEYPPAEIFFSSYSLLYTPK